MSTLTAVKREVSRCILCHNAKCNKACDGKDMAKIIRSLYFDNFNMAAQLLRTANIPSDAWDEAKALCPARVDLTAVYEAFSAELPNFPEQDVSNVDISAEICGVKLENPFLLSSSVVGSSYEMVARALDMGWAGVAYKTISYMDIKEASPRFSINSKNNGSWCGFKNIEQLSDHTVEENMAIFRKIKENYPNKVLVVSIMGRNEDEWETLARLSEENGADVIECNFSCPNMEAKDTGSDVGQIPELVSSYTAAVRRGTKLPILAKMTPNIQDMCIPARAAMSAGADGIAAINTIKSITGVDLEQLVAQPVVNGKSMLGGYSGAAVKPIALRFISDMAKDEQLKNLHFSAMGGIYTWRDGAEFIALGAGSLQITTAVMEYGYRIIDDLISGLRTYMAQHGFTSINDFRGKALETLVDNDRIDRNSRVFPKFDRTKCVGCGRCYISCRDGGHQAIRFDEKTQKVTMDATKCVGCMLCSLVCPFGVIGESKRIQQP